MEHHNFGWENSQLSTGPRYIVSMLRFANCWHNRRVNDCSWMIYTLVNLHNCAKSQLLMGPSTISMPIFSICCWHNQSCFLLLSHPFFLYRHYRTSLKWPAAAIPWPWQPEAKLIVGAVSGARTWMGSASETFMACLDRAGSGHAVDGWHVGRPWGQTKCGYIHTRTCK